jgi:hypothetical protein
MAFQLSGNTRTVPFTVVLQMLHQAEVSGTLTIRRDEIEKCIQFKKGQIIFSTSNDVKDRLGEILVRDGHLTRESLEAALVLLNKQGGTKKIGAILVENGFVSPKNLFAGLKSQVKEIICSLFLWEDADYAFEEQIPAETIQLQFNLPELISEIICRIKNES